MTENWVNRYLNRIQYHGNLAPNVENLTSLQEAHIYSVPFEDLDIHYGVPLSLELNDLVEKVIEKNRGGFCYELNYLFGSLLEALGFRVTYLSARVFNEDTGEEGPEFDHMALVVTLGEKWLVDVGFGGRAFTQPLSILKPDIQIDPAGFFRIDEVGNDRFQVVRSLDRNEFLPLYNFSLDKINIENFYAECQWKQTDPQSHFVKNKICTMATPKGRKSVLNDVFTIREGKIKSTFEIIDLQHERRILSDHFNIDLPG
jgi:N-hydroxyarylamine O-acetyltransferase